MCAARFRAHRWFLASVAVLGGAAGWHWLQGGDGVGTRTVRRPQAATRDPAVAENVSTVVAASAEVRTSTPPVRTVAPPREIECDPGRLREWLWALPDDSFQSLIGTPRLDDYVAAIVAHLERPDRGIAAPERGEFLTRLNERILRLSENR